MNPIAVNPAAVGFYDGNFRIGAYNRSQWFSITKAYQTNGLWFDVPLAKRSSHQDIFGLGMTFDFDQAGDSKFTSLQSNLMLSYIRALNRKNNHFLMIGISGGIAQRTINYASLSFDEQFKADIYNNSNPITETFPTSSFLFGDCGIGLQWFYQPSNAFYYQLGVSAFHLNRPRQSLLKDKSIYMPIKGNIQLTAGFGINTTMIITPSVFYSQQGQYRELLLGCLYTYIISRDLEGVLSKFEIGLDYRWNDAIYIVMGSEFKRIRINISYDFNVSKLLPASDARGGIEISLYYILKKKKVFKRESIPCPIF
jgi:type IX secretion system PorP/SprF family membrane protein